MNSDNFIKLASLGLSGDKKELVEFLQDLAADSSNSNRRKLYTEIKKLLATYEEVNSLTVSSGSNHTVERKNDLWFTRSLQRKLDRVLATFSSSSVPYEYKSKFNKILLYGPPGSGKTTIGHYIAEALGESIEYVKLSDVISYKFGETLKNLASIFENNNSSVVFIDEFDAFAKSRFDSNDVGELKRIVNSLIQTLDVLSGDRVVIVATNLKDDIDPAIMRRFPIKLSVPELNKSERSEFIDYLIVKNEKKVDLKAMERKLLDDVITVLNLKTIDSIKSLFDATVVNAHIRSASNIGLIDFFETMITDGILDSKQAKKMQDNNPVLIQKIFKTLEKRFTKIEISEYMGVHRNSIGNYVQ